jgi:hypothetical protein
MGLDSAAAARAAVADGIEAPQHGILEECMVSVPALILLPQDFDSLLLR